MKKFIFCGVLLLLLSGLGAQAQTLIFKQVLLLGTSVNSGVVLGTVPSGRVWKITASGTEITGSGSCGFSFNGSTAAFRVGGVYSWNEAYTLANSIEDIWLPAGTTLTALSCGSNYRWVSVIEFEIGP